MAEFYTIGHSNRALSEFIRLLKEAGLTHLADVRSIPKSRYNPQYNADVLRVTLPEQGIRYTPMPALGGLRPKSTEGPSANAFWTDEKFRNYADYATSPEFRRALAELRRLGAANPFAIMCAEANWRHCHRQIIADYLLGCGDSVTHIMGEGRLEPGRLTSAALVDRDGVITYPAAQGDLLL